MRILYIGKFGRLWDEEYIARSFEMLGHTVGRESENTSLREMLRDIDDWKPDIVLFAKLQLPYAEKLLEECKKRKIKTVCWIFDLYWGYSREHRIKTDACFKADRVFTTDGGNDLKWDVAGIYHDCVRQGIYTPECVMLEGEKIYDVVFVGSDNPNNNRGEMLEKIRKDFDFHWFGKEDTNAVRGMELNKLFAQTKVVVGDSVYSPHYWSNRVVETLGRGGFLIHAEVEGLKEEYPHLVTYKRGDYADLEAKIQYYLDHDDERNDIIKKNFEWVRDNYTCEKKCRELIRLCLK